MVEVLKRPAPKDATTDSQRRPRTGAMPTPILKLKSRPNSPTCWCVPNTRDLRQHTSVGGQAAPGRRSANPAPRPLPCTGCTHHLSRAGGLRAHATPRALDATL